MKRKPDESNQASTERFSERSPIANGYREIVAKTREIGLDTSGREYRMEIRDVAERNAYYI